MKKVRMETWYWGSYCLAPTNMALPKGFEEYEEKVHGWQHSEEYRLNAQEQYNNGKPVHIKEITNKGE